MIGQLIQTKRKDKRVTQEELAQKMGVTKSSISKWETGQTYPDIFLLPKPATYFNVSIDELLGYSPQLTKTEISDLYQCMAEKFATKSFDEVFYSYSVCFC